MRLVLLLVIRVSADGVATSGNCAALASQGECERDPHGMAQSCTADCAGLLHSAATQGHAGLVRALLEGGAAADTRNHQGATALHFAAFGNSGAVLNVLMSAGAAVDARESSQGATALHFAAFGNHTDAVRVLHEGGAAMDATDDGGATALHTAVSRHPTSNAGPPASRSSD